MQAERIALVDEVHVSLLTEAGLISPVNGIVMRGCVEKPSSSLMTSMSSHSAFLTAQSGLGRLTRRNVFCVQSRTVNRSLGKGMVSMPPGSNLTLTPAAAAARGIDSATPEAMRDQRGI